MTGAGRSYLYHLIITVLHWPEVPIRTLPKECFANMGWSEAHWTQRESSINFWCCATDSTKHNNSSKAGCTGRTAFSFTGPYHSFTQGQQCLADNLFHPTLLLKVTWFKSWFLVAMNIAVSAWGWKMSGAAKCGSPIGVRVLQLCVSMSSRFSIHIYTQYIGMYMHIYT